MRKLNAFLNVSLDGYYAGPGGDISWAHQNDPEWQAFVAENAKGGGELLFGRKTYEMMVSYWPTPAAAKNDPVVAQRMNELPKVVFSRTLKSASWNNTRVLQGDMAAEIRELKSEPGPGMAILGSGSIVRQLTQAGLLDELQLVVHPLVLGGGHALFEGLHEKRPLKLIKTRSFQNGNVLVCYAPAT